MQGCAGRSIFCRKPTQNRHPHRHHLSRISIGVGAIAAVIIVVILAPFILLFRWVA